MAHHAHVEEVSDSDPEEMDIGNIEPNSSSNSLIDPVNIPSQVREQAITPRVQMNAAAQAEQKEKTKRWQCLYPVYFDKSRTRQEGRRVGKELAVDNPLAREIVDAVRFLGINVVFEPAKTHPKDWANPGRVRCLVKEDGQKVSSIINNKHHLYLKVAEHLRQHPTTKESPLAFRFAGMPPQEGPPPPPAAPRGWKMGTILPLHSPAATGGGVSENLFKDMMNEMQGQSGEAGAPGGAIKSKKDKKKGKP